MSRPDSSREQLALGLLVEALRVRLLLLLSTHTLLLPGLWVRSSTTLHTRTQTLVIHVSRNRHSRWVVTAKTQEAAENDHLGTSNEVSF